MIPSITRRLSAQSSASRRRAAGQVLVIVAVGLIVMIAMVGLVIDGGYAWGRQRDAQNASDASAEAGAIVMAERLAGITRTDADVWAAVTATAVANDYPPAVRRPSRRRRTAREGPRSTRSACAPTTPTSMATSSTTEAAPMGGRRRGRNPITASGVEANGRSRFDTFLMQVIGFNELDATADATAVAGYVEEHAPRPGLRRAARHDPGQHRDLRRQRRCRARRQRLHQEHGDAVRHPAVQEQPGQRRMARLDPPAGGASELADAIDIRTIHQSRLPSSAVHHPRPAT